MRVTKRDLQKLLGYALEELGRFYKVARGKYAVYRGRLLAIALCQDAARNYVFGDARVEDLDIWFFFKEHERVKLPGFRNMRKSIEGSLPTLGRKRLDFLKKMITPDLVVQGEPAASIRGYLSSAGTRSARELATRPVVGLYPESLFDKKIWLPPHV